MAKEEPEASAAEAADTPETPPGRSRKRMLMLIGGGLGVVLLAAVGGHLAGLTDALLGQEESEQAQPQTPPPPSVFFYALPDIVVSLNAANSRPMFLKVRVTLELPDATDVPRVERLMPRIIDYFQSYLRELHPDDLRGSAGTARLREELLRRIAAAIAPTEVHNVLFSELLLQ
jgi:flagellar FliL protein